MNHSTIQAKPGKNPDQKPQGQHQQEHSLPTPSLGGMHIQRDPRSRNPNSLMQLQRSIGNRAVGSMLGVNQISKAPQNAPVIQRKFDGALEGKSTEEAMQLLKEAGYTLRPFHRDKIERLRVSTAPRETVSSLEGLATEIGLGPLKKTTTEESQSTPSGRNFKVVPRTQKSGGTSTEPSSTQPETPKYNFKVPVKKSKVEDTSTTPEPTPEVTPKLKRKVKGSSGISIGGGTEWTQASSKIAVKGFAEQGEPPQDFGQLSMTYSFIETGLTFHANVFSNPKLMWEQGDKVTITLQFKNGTSHLIGDLRVQKTGNIVTLDGAVTFDDLASMLKAELPSKGSVEDKREALAGKSSQMGLLAMWRTKEDVGEQHRSGGIDQKGGSGLINVSATPITESTLKKTETENIRNVGWNENEIATKERPIVKKFPNLFKLGSEIATTLEAESEYIVGWAEYDHILKRMGELSSKSVEELIKEFGIQKEVKASVKHYEDTYYDLDLGIEEGKDRFPLLERDIVFRRRSVPKEKNDGVGDPEGTNLIAIKGRSVTSEGEAIRLASQFQANYDLLDKEQQTEVMNFLRSEQVDNPFARTLQDKLGENVGLLERAKSLKKSVEVKSQRTKYKLWLENSTMIDLSVDAASGHIDGYEAEPVVYSFEFGVGHPGLSTGVSGGGLSEEDPVTLKLQQDIEDIDTSQKEGTYDLRTHGTKPGKLTQIKNRQEKTNTLVHRPYHVPKDLDNDRLFQKDDYIQYKNLRDLLIKDLFGLKKDKLDRGGNKAKVLAQMIQSGGI